MLVAASNVQFRNNLILGKSETPETFAVETNTNYSSSDYNGFRPNEGAQFSFEWSSPPFWILANYAAKGTLSPQERIKAEAARKKTDDSRRSGNTARPRARTGTAYIVDYDVFQKVTPPDPTIRACCTSLRISISNFAQDRWRWMPECGCRTSTMDSRARRRIWAHTKWASRCRTTARGSRSSISRLIYHARSVTLGVLLSAILIYRSRCQSCIRCPNSRE